MVPDVHRNHEAYQGRGEGGGGGGWRWGGRLYTYRYTVTTIMNSAIKVGCDERHFNVSLIAVRDKVSK